MRRAVITAVWVASVLIVSLMGDLTAYAGVLLCVVAMAIVSYAARTGTLLPLMVFRAWRTWMEAHSVEAEFVTLKLPRGVHTETRVTLCTTCAFAQVVQGFGHGETIMICGYAFPPRDVVFAVSECTDYKPKRKRIGVEMAIERVVSSPPLV